MLSKFRRFIFGVSIFINLSIFFILFTPLTEQLCKPLIINEALRKSEAIVILAGDYFDSGMLGLETIVRLKKGLELYRRGWADRLICVGGSRFDKINKTIADVMKEELILYGVGPNAILTQGETINTYNDIRGLIKKFAGELDFNKAIFVTSPYHTFRVKQILSKRGISARVVPTDLGQLSPRVWSQRLDLFRQVLREYAAICYFKMRGYI